MAHRGRQNADDILALALATGQTLRGAANLAGIGERTATRRWADPAFRGKVSGLRAELVAQAVGKLADATGMAVDAMKALLDAQSEAVRLGAARSILELGNKLQETVELEERLRTVEERMKGKTGS